MFRIKTANISVVLVKPAIAGNVGAVARVIKNFGFPQLIVVAPQTDILSPEALARASHAQDILKSALVVADLKEALVPFQYVVGTTGKRRYKLTRYLPREVASQLAAISQQNRIALLFGPERIGLTNEELTHCHCLITIPTSSQHTSLNLSHAVAVVLYELFCQQLTGISWCLPPLATWEELEQMYQHLMSALGKVGFVIGGPKGHTYRVLKRLFNKMPLTQQDVKIIRGICRQIDWFASQKHL